MSNVRNDPLLSALSIHISSSLSSNYFLVSFSKQLTFLSTTMYYRQPVSFFLIPSSLHPDPFSKPLLRLSSRSFQPSLHRWSPRQSTRPLSPLRWSPLPSCRQLSPPLSSLLQSWLPRWSLLRTRRRSHPDTSNWYSTLNNTFSFHFCYFAYV